MQGEEEAPVSPQRWAGRKGASTAAAAAILIVVIVVVGAGGYFGLNAVAPSSTAGHTSTGSTTTCQPETSAYCKNQSPPPNPNDVILTVPYQAGYGETIGHVAQGTSVPASLSVSGHESVNTWTVNWGDGAVNTSTSPLLTHVYTTLGTYAISGSALVGTTTHIGTGYLFPIEVTPSITTTTSGLYPSVSATLLNGTRSTSFNEPWLTGPGTFTVNLTVTGPPSDTAWVAQPPTLISSGGTLTTTTPSGDTSGVAGTLAVATAGAYQITAVGPVENSLTHAVVYQNYTWGIYVSSILAGYATGCGSCSTFATHPVTDPHPGTIDNYEVVPGGATSVDPAVDYESVGAEVISNVYQTLVTYNGSSTATFLPQLSTCVPGTAQCQSLYGSSLVTDGNFSSGGAPCNPSPQNATCLPEYWTFVIDKNANFYDPSTTTSWGVYPTDVMDSFARTLAFSITPFFGSNPGWIQAQSLLSAGSATFDGGFHDVFNNTGANILASMFINDSTYCPAAAITSEHGCITFNASGGGNDWPFFLELVSVNLGAGIVPCGWFGYMGAGPPGFVTSATDGDGPCLLPDTNAPTVADRESTNNSYWAAYLASITLEGSAGFTAWDAFQANAINTPNVFSDTRFTAVGSGPYYLASLTRGVGYVLEANPAYAQPNCASDSWCMPAAGQYAHTVNIFWEPSDQVGIQEYIQGQADFAVIQTPDTATMLNLEATGKIGILTLPTINIFFNPINLEVNTKMIDQYYTGPVHIPGNYSGASNFFSYVGLRQFLVNAFPYTQDLQQVITIDGIVGGINYGGAIPQFMGNYYPSNVTWPAGQPNTNPADVGGAAWWWAQANDPSSPYYDPLLAQCTTSNPCTFPVGGEEGDTQQNGAYPIWEQWVSTLTGGRISFTEVDLSFSQLVIYAESSTAYTNPLPIFALGWAPDYPDPTDYVAPMYLPNATYTAPDAVEQAFTNDSVVNAQCPGGDTFANLSYWASQFGVPQYCQGTAYGVMTWANEYAGALPVGPERVLYYNLASHIANNLALYLYQFQETLVDSYAPWIAPASISTNVVTGGIGAYYEVQGNGLL